MGGTPTDSLTMGQVRAAAEDLGYLAAYLTVVSEERYERLLTPPDEALAVEAGGWATTLAELSRAIQEEIQPAMAASAVAEG